MKTVFLASHTTGKRGGLESLESFYRGNNYNTYKLLNPLDDYSKLPTTLDLNGETILSIPRKNIGILNLFIDLFYVLRNLKRKKIDIYVGASNFDMFPGIIFKKLTRKEYKTLYFPRDYSEDRFGNKILDWIYIRLEKFVLKNSNITVSNTFRSENKRLELGLKKENSAMIRNGINSTNYHFNEKVIDKGKFIFIGSLTKEHGLLFFLKICKQFVNELIVIGLGPECDEVKELCEKENIKCTFIYNKPYDYVKEFLANFDGLGLAPYTLDEKWTHYCSPLKVVEYISFGIPVIMSDVPEICEEVVSRNVGIKYHSLDAVKIKQSIDLLDIKDFNQRAKSFYHDYKNESLFSILL